MPNKPNMETLSVQDLQNDTAAIVKQVGETKQPVRINANGQPPVIVLDEGTYDWYIHLINFSRLINEAEADVRAGNVAPVKEFFNEMRRGKRVSS